MEMVKGKSSENEIASTDAARIAAVDSGMESAITEKLAAESQLDESTASSEQQDDIDLSRRSLIPNSNAQVQVVPPSELSSLRLDVRGGGYGSWKKPKKKGAPTVWKPASNAVIEINEWVVQEGEVEQHMYRGVTRVNNGPDIPLEIACEDLYDNVRFKVAWAKATGPFLACDDRQLGHIRNTIAMECAAIKTNVLNEIGPVEGRGYLAPTFAIKNGEFVEHEGYSVKLPSSNQALQRLGLSRIPDKHVRVVGHHILKRLVPLMGDQVALPLLAHAFIAPFHRAPEIIRDINPCGIFLYGPSGIGKTTNGVYIQSFFGDFTNKLSLLNARSTANLIEDRGWWFNGALFVIDDLKLRLLGKSEARQKMAVLQAAADGGCRERLTKNITERASRPIRGLVIVLAEDLPEGETSLLARFLLVPFRDSKLAKEKIRHLKGRCDGQMKRYRGFMAAFIAWAQREWPPIKIRQEIVAGRDCIHEKLSGAAVENSERVAQNFALNRAGAVMMFGFMRNLGVIDDAGHEDWLGRYDGAIETLLFETAHVVSAERPAEQFIRLVRQLIGANAATLADQGGEEKQNTIGFFTRGQIALYPDLAYGYANKLQQQVAGESLPHSKRSVGNQLKSGNYLVRCEEGHNTVKVTFEGQSHRVWLFEKSTIFGESDPKVDQVMDLVSKRTPYEERFGVTSVDDLREQQAYAIKHLENIVDLHRKAKKREGTYNPNHEIVEHLDMRERLSHLEKEVRKEPGYSAKSEIDWLQKKRDDLKKEIKNIEKQEASREALSQQKKEVRKDSGFSAKSEIDWLTKQIESLEQKIKEVEKQERNRTKKKKKKETYV